MIETFSRYLPEGREKQGYKPYVVSGDLMLILQKWADEKGLGLPSTNFFTTLRTEFNETMKSMFPSYEYVNENELKNGITQLVNKERMPTITLDSVYFRPEYAETLDITRYVDDRFNDRGLGRRPGSPPLRDQFRVIKESGIKNARLVDDVIFSGEQTERVINTLSRSGVEITSVCAGIAVQEGITRLSNLGVTVEAVRTYEDVIDEVCERDFYPGISYCGRTQDYSLNKGIPYILPFGNPSGWASIPEENQEAFSQFCMKQTLKLFEAIESVSGRRVFPSDINRKFGSVIDQTIVPITDTLRQIS